MRRSMKTQKNFLPILLRRLVIAAAALPAIAALLSMEWPSAAAEMHANFAGGSGKRPVLGYSFRSEAPVRSVASGEILFIQNESEGLSGLPAPLGTWLAVDHGDGLIGIYGRLNEGSNPFPYRIEQNSLIGFSGLSGWAGASGFYFSFFDRTEKRWVNPGMILPPLEDSRPPLIRSVIFRNSEGRDFNLAQTRALSQGQYRILVDAQDTRLGASDSPLSPHRITCYVNGAERGSINFETLSSRRGMLFVSTSAASAPASEVYEFYPSLSAGEVWLTRGQAAVEIIVEDIAGNSRIASFRFLVE
jgi:hypothetical protein